MSRASFHRPPGTVLVETVATVPTGRRKGLMFSFITENGVPMGEVLHVGLTPGGKPIVPRHPQRVVVREETVARFVESAAKLGVRLREARR